MINITQLREYFNKFAVENKYCQLAEISEFIDFVEEEQKGQSQGSVISLEAREMARTKKELRERQAELGRLDPEEEFNKIKE